MRRLVHAFGSTRRQRQLKQKDLAQVCIPRTCHCSHSAELFTPASTAVILFRNRIRRSVQACSVLFFSTRSEVSVRESAALRHLEAACAVSVLPCLAGRG